MVDIAIAIGIGLLAGVYAGFLGVGGGIIMVPAMVLFLGQGQQIAQGTSLLVIVATAFAGTRANVRRGTLDRPLAGLLGIGGIAGAILGSILALHVFGDDALRRIFGVVLILVAVRMIAKPPARASAEP